MSRGVPSAVAFISLMKSAGMADSSVESHGGAWRGMEGMIGTAWECPSALLTNDLDLSPAPLLILESHSCVQRFHFLNACSSCAIPDIDGGAKVNDEHITAVH